jgi:hypothetical protein
MTRARSQLDRGGRTRELPANYGRDVDHPQLWNDFLIFQMHRMNSTYVFL